MKLPKKTKLRKIKYIIHKVIDAMDS